MVSATKPNLFHTGWFVQSIFTQTLIIHVIPTTKTPFVQRRTSNALLVTSVMIVVIAAWLLLTQAGKRPVLSGQR